MVKVVFTIQGNVRTYELLDNHTLKVDDEDFNRILIPNKLKTLCSDSRYKLSYKNINIDAFDLFMALILTPKDIKIPNPKNLTSKDLKPIIQLLTYEDDLLHVIAITNRLDDKPFEHILCKIAEGSPPHVPPFIIQFILAIAIACFLFCVLLSL